MRVTITSRFTVSIILVVITTVKERRVVAINKESGLRYGVYRCVRARRKK